MKIKRHYNFVLFGMAEYDAETPEVTRSYVTYMYRQTFYTW